MADTGLVALDPLRLGVLEERLQWLDPCFRRWADDVEGALAGTGTAAPEQVAELRDLASWCRRTHDEVRWRRAAVEAIGGLPATAWTFRSAAEARHRAERLAARVRDASSGDPPSWPELRALLVELDRGRRSPTFAAAFFAALGGAATAALPATIELAFLADWRARAPWSPERALGPVPPPLHEALAVLRMQERLADGVRRASRAEGDLALTDDWLADFTGSGPDAPAGAVDEEASERARRALGTADYGLRFTQAVARAVGAGRVALVLGGTRVVLGLVRAEARGGPLPGSVEITDADVLEAVASVGLVVAGAAANPLVVAGGLAVGALFLTAAHLVGRSPVQGSARNRRGRHAPTHDPETGRTRTPAGHATNPNVDQSGVPLPPSYA